MTKKGREHLRVQAIESENIRIKQIRDFLNVRPLESVINKAIALEFNASIEESIEVLKKTKNRPFTKPFKWDYPDQH
jgi:hypothetical protein